MSNGSFHLTLKTVSSRSAPGGRVVAVVTFETTLKDFEEFQELERVANRQGWKLNLYGSFEEDVASVLRDDRDQWKKKAEALQQRVDYLEKLQKQSST